MKQRNRISVQQTQRMTLTTTLAASITILRADAATRLDPHLCRLMPIWTALRPSLSTEPSPCPTRPPTR